MPFVPRQVVAPPTFTPLPSGLLTVAEAPAPGSHWANGVTYQSFCVTGMGSLTWDECLVVTGTGSPVPPQPTKTGNVQSAIRGATPFTCYVEFDCSAVGNNDPTAAAQSALDRAASWQVEQAFWTGGSAAGQPFVFPHLAATTALVDVQGIVLQTVPVTGGPFDVADGLGFLEDYLGDCYGGAGVIHVPARLLPTLDAWGLVKRQGAALTTLAGNRVAVGLGYPGTNLSGGAPGAGNVWMFATGAVFAYTGPPRITDKPGAVDRAENTIRMIAEKTYVLGWECCHAGVEVSLGVPVT